MIPPRLALPSMLAAALALVALTPSGGPRAEATPPDGRLLSEAMEEARAGDWAAALDRARAADAGVGADIILWTRLRDGQGSFSDYADFLARDSDWPGLAQIRRQAEGKLPGDLPPAEVVAFFGRAPTLTPGGALRRANALADLGRTTEAETEILRAWTTMPMSGREQADIYTVWRRVVAPRDTDRLDMLLWEGRTDQAENMLPLVPADWQALARARIGVREDVDGSTALIDAVPESLRDDPGLAFERYLFRVRKGRWLDAAEYMLSHSTSAATLGRPDMWMERRANLAREALQRGDVAMAYGLAASGPGTAGTDYADAEWLAGFIALTRMDDPKTAIGHFETFGRLVDTPISLGRAGYWLGRAEAAAGDAAAADRAYRAGARYQTSFYGQLAAEAAGLDFDPGIAGAAPPDWQGAPGTDRAVVRAARLILLSGDDVGAARFFRQAAEGQSAEARAAVAQMAIDSGRPHIGLRVAKDAAAAGIVLPSQYSRCTRGPPRAGRCRRNGRWRSRGRNRSSTPPPEATRGRRG